MTPTEGAITDRDRKLILAACLLVARADAALKETERAELERMCRAWFPGEDATLFVEKLLHNELTAEEIVAGLSGPPAKDTLWMCLTSIAAVDPSVAPAEQEVIDRFARLLGREPSQSGRAASGTASEAPRGPGPTPEPGESAEKAAERTVLWFSVYSAIVGAVPQPFFSDFTLILPAQVWMLRRIAAHYGVAFDRQMIAEFAGIAALSAGAETLRRTLARFVPVLPRSATDAASQFAVTYGLGMLAIAYFKRGRRLETDVLRTTYDDARRKGAEIYARFASLFHGRTEKDVDGIVGNILKSIW